jgi:hypothetical protein
LKKLILVAAFLFAAGVSTVAVSDWVAKDAAGLNIVFDAITLSGGKQLPKHVSVDTSGNAVGTASSPLNVTMAQGGVSATVTPAGALKTDGSAVTQPVSGTLGATQSGAWNVGVSSALPTGTNTIGNVGQASAPWAMNLSQANGAALSVGNPISTQIAQGGAVIAAGNPLPTTCISGCTTGGTSDSSFATYSAAASYTGVATAADSSCVIGSATKTVRVRKLTVSAFSVFKRGTANTGGSANAIAIAKHDSTDPAATASAVTYGGSPTEGSLAGTVAYFTYYNGGTITPYTLTWGIGVRGDKSIVLRGTGELLCLDGAPAGNSMTVSWEWTEED